METQAKNTVTAEFEAMAQDVMAKVLKEGYTLNQLRGITPDELEAIYSVGFNFYQTGKFAEAEKIFRFLVLLNHLDSKYWTALGAVLQVQKNFDKAIEAYGMATFLDIHNSKSQYFAAECHLLQGNAEKALSALTALETYATSSPTSQEFLAKGKALKAKIEGKQGE